MAPKARQAGLGGADLQQVCENVGLLSDLAAVADL